jgi:hypothetical protein
MTLSGAASSFNSQIEQFGRMLESLMFNGDGFQQCGLVRVG